jgi:hypothetical protein
MADLASSTPKARSARRAARAGVLAGVTFSAALVAGGYALVGRAQGPGAPALPSHDGTAAGAAGAPGAASPGAPAATVKVTILTVPQAKKVTVLWGKKRLGIIESRKPLILQRPRDSGPMDLILQSEGYIPVQTRAFTFADYKLSVKLTPIDQKKTLLGYRQEVPPPDAGASQSPDAGVPPPATPPPAAALPPGAAPPPAPLPGAR